MKHPSSFHPGLSLKAALLGSCPLLYKCVNGGCGRFPAHHQAALWHQQCLRFQLSSDPSIRFHRLRAQSCKSAPHLSLWGQSEPVHYLCFWLTGRRWEVPMAPDSSPGSPCIWPAVNQRVGSHSLLLRVNLLEQLREVWGTFDSLGCWFVIKGCNSWISRWKHIEHVWEHCMLLTFCPRSAEPPPLGGC